MPDRQSNAEFPVVSFVGRSGSGKTTFLEKVIAELTERGYRVATVKHHTHKTDIDVPGKDSWRHAKAGARQVVLKGQGVLAVFSKLDAEPTFDELLGLIEGADVVLAEGFHRESRAAIEVSRTACATELVNDPISLFAIVTDNEFGLADIPVFGLNDYRAVSDLIEERFLMNRLRAS